MRSSRTPTAVVLTALASVLLLGGCAGSPTVRLPPVGGVPDYQLGIAYDPSVDVDIVARDSTDEPAGAGYDICYLNAFQTQPGELATWPAELVLTDTAGEPVTDPGWPDEVLLDTATAAHRTAIAERIGKGIDACATKGFDAVEFDNLDSYTRSDNRLGVEHNIALAILLTEHAHARGLAVAQKNEAEMSVRLRSEVGFDFVVAEECARFRECAGYADVYGDAVIDIEYSDDLPVSFSTMCAEGDSPASMILRDRNLTAPDDSEYVFESCARDPR